MRYGLRLPPGVEEFGHFDDLFVILSSKILIFVRVLFEVIEFGFSGGVIWVSGRSSAVGESVVFLIMEEELPITLNDVAGFHVSGSVVGVEHVMVTIVAVNNIAFSEGRGIAEVDSGHCFWHFDSNRV